MVKSEKGAIPVLNVMLDVFSNMPKEYYVDSFSDFKANVETHLLPLLFKTKNKIKKPKFVDRDQNEIVVQVLVQIGMKRSAPVIDFIRSMFSDAAQEENPKGRMRCLAVLAELTRAIPDEIEKVNNELFPFLQPILLGTCKHKREIELAVLTFPLIHPQDEAVLVQIATVLFE